MFAVAAFTDGLDGYIARSRGSVTTFGKLMDPLADKLLIIAPLISLASLNRIAPWVAMVIIARELAVTMLRMVAVERGVVIAASWLGKAKTMLQVAAIFAVIAFETTPLAVDALGLAPAVGSRRIEMPDARDVRALALRLTLATRPMMAAVPKPSAGIIAGPSLVAELEHQPVGGHRC